MSKTEKEKMLAGELYRADSPEIQADQAAAMAWLARYNAAIGHGNDVRHALLCERFASVGAGAAIRPPFHCDYGYNIRLGDGVFLNFGCVFLDSILIEVGAGTQIGPCVQIYGADHTRDPAQRRAGHPWPGARVSARPCRRGGFPARTAG